MTLFQLCPHMAFPLYVHTHPSGVSSSSCKDTSFIQLGLHPYDLIKFNYLLKGPILTTVAWPVRASAYEFWRNSVQSLWAILCLPLHPVSWRGRHAHPAARRGGWNQPWDKDTGSAEGDKRERLPLATTTAFWELTISLSLSCLFLPKLQSHLPPWGFQTVLCMPRCSDSLNVRFRFHLKIHFKY